jgi:hypothetical protein
VKAWLEILAGDWVAWLEFSQKSNFCAKQEEFSLFLAAPALHTAEISFTSNAVIENVNKNF